MAAAPQFKVYNERLEYEAATKSPEAAAAIIAGIGCNGWTIRYGHGVKHIVWTEGVDEGPAGESFDIVAETCWSRIRRAAMERAARHAESIVVGAHVAAEERTQP